MPRPGRGPQEKSKDFFGAMKRLINGLSKWHILITVSLLLAFFSSVLSLIAPNKLSDFTNEISNGLVPKTEVIEKISKEMFGNITTDEFSMVYVYSDIPKEDLDEFSKIMSKLPTTKDEEKQTLILSIPNSILEKLLDPIEVDNVEISVKDQIKSIEVFREMGNEKQTTNALNAIDKLPKSVYSLIEPSMNTKKIRNIAILLGIIYVLSSLFSYIQNFIMATVSNKFAKSLRSDITKKINRLPLKYFDSHENGDILSRVTNDVDSISQNLNQSLGTLVSSLSLFIGSIIMMFVTNWTMAITAILSCIIGFVFMFFVLKRSQKYFSEQQKVLGDLNGFIEEMYSGHSVVKAYNGEAEAIEKFNVLNEKLNVAKRRSIFLSGTMQPMMGFVGNLGYVAVCIVGALLAMNGNISFGVIVAFMIYIRLFTNPLSQIAQALTSLQSTAAASERVYEFLDEKEMSDQKNITKHLNRSKIKGNIKFEHVKFGYDKSRTIIKDFSVDVKDGQKVAIVGPTGAGKTTMVNLLMKFYEINSGDIKINGVSTKELSRENIHDLFCMVLQDTWLFDGTIRDNIKYNKVDTTDEEIWEALRVVGCDHFVSALPNDLDAHIDDSDSISGGQKQLFTIARGMLEDAPFLILDEATSNVDTRTEELVQKAMDKLCEGRTSFIIAHRLSTIKNADIILVMNEGNIIEQGNHEELMKKNGFYADLYNSQFQK